MASQPVSSVNSCVKVASFIQGYHAYQDVWQPVVGEVLLSQREPSNMKDSQAVSVMKSNLIVGHVPANLFSHFISRTCNKDTAEVTGARVNWAAGHGLEIPCIYHLYGPAAYLVHLDTIIQAR